MNIKRKYLDFEFKENYLNIEVKLHTDMNNLNNVYVIESLNREEFQKIKNNGKYLFIILKRFIFFTLLQGLIFNNFDFFDIYDPYICLVFINYISN